MARKAKRKAARRPARKSSRSKSARKAPKRVARRPAKKAKSRARPRAKPRRAPSRPAPRAAPPHRRVLSRMATIEKDRRALKLASVILGLFAALHLVRFVTGFTLIVDDVLLPLNASGVIVIIFGVLSLWYYRLSLD